MKDYLEEIIDALDFQSLNQFLNEHMRLKMDIAQLIEEISINGLDALNKENITQFFFDSMFYEISIVRPIFIKILVFSVLFSELPPFRVILCSIPCIIAKWWLYPTFSTLQSRAILL